MSTCDSCLPTKGGHHSCSKQLAFRSLQYTLAESRDLLCKEVMRGSLELLLACVRADLTSWASAFAEGHVNYKRFSFDAITQVKVPFWLFCLQVETHA